MDRKFDVAKWRNDQYSKEIEQTDKISQLRSLIREEIQKILTENLDNNEFEYGTYSKDEVIAKVGPGGQVRWFNKVVTVDELPDQVQFTKVISGIPTFINAGEYKTPGDSMAGFDPEEEKRYVEKRKRDKNI
jgi:hypothetical protein